MSAIDHQIMFIAKLREFTGRAPAVYANQTELFLNSLWSMSEHLINLKRAILNDACEDLAGKLDKGALSDKTIAEFKDLLEKLVSGRDFQMICGSMTGNNKGLIKERLATLVPLSLVDEEKKTEDRDMEADRQIEETYARLNFAPLVKELNAAPESGAVDAVLAKARVEVEEYCCLYHIPLDEGDTFTPFSLLRVDAVIAASYRILSEISEKTGSVNLGEKLILIVDDDEAVRDLLDFLVRKEGFKVEKAADGEEAIQKAKTLHPDLILLDLMLPKYGGFEILRELQGEDTSDIPIIIVTGRNLDHSTSEMIKQEPNVKDFMGKPIKPQVLATLLHTLLKTQGKK
ncbi:MAG: response regulator [Elusimicrobia bacterium]|nr:response regulator [Elusimicrobiota bacterium]